MRPKRNVSPHLRLIVLAAPLAIAWPLAAGEASVPVRIGTHEQPDLDACLSVGEVSGLKPSGDGFLAVRRGPGTHYAIADKLTAGRRFHLCDWKEEGGWHGIVYSPDGSLDCGVSSPVASPRVYSGKCKSGWVNRRWVKVVAG
ncbi:hypothetical protein [Arenimonas sp.]|uniref:hypothetical protein n=1 Tax=Arenimonas sp. TaxID=1872635 RepID=UPI0039E292B9